MKRTYFAILAAFACAAVASAAQKTATLSTESGTTGTNSAVMTAATVYGLDLNTWKGTWENGSLNGQVAFDADHISLQIGAAANGNGNYAGLHFELPGLEAGPESLTFTYTKASQWGGSIGSFDCTYTCTVYGFDSTGTATTLGTWSLAKAEELTQGDAQNVSIALTVPADASFASFGVVFNSKETTSLGGGAGMAANIANLAVTYTASLTETTVTDVSVAGTAITLTVADNLTDVNNGFNVIVGDTAWESIVTGMAAAGGIYQNAIVTLTDGNGNNIDLATYNGGTVTLNGYAGAVDATSGDREYFVAYIPEPATATLSLLALAALAARRRRK